MSSLLGLCCSSPGRMNHAYLCAAHVTWCVLYPGASLKCSLLTVFQLSVNIQDCAAHVLCSGKCMERIWNHPPEASSSVQMFVSAGGPGLCKVRDSHPCRLWSQCLHTSPSACKSAFVTLLCKTFQLKIRPKLPTRAADTRSCSKTSRLFHCHPSLHRLREVKGASQAKLSLYPLE